MYPYQVIVLFIDRIQVTNVLKLAEDLEVKGLTVPGENLLQPEVVIDEYTTQYDEDLKIPSVPPHFLEDVKEVTAEDDTVNVDKSFVCDTCHLIYKTKKLLNRHLKKHTAVKITCPTCDKLFTRKDTILVHMRNQHPGV